MAFPTSPVNGQQANVNGITYTYSSARSAWTVTSSFLDTFTGNALIANSATISNELSAGSIVTGNILPAANNTYSLGNATTVWTDLYLSNSTIYLGEATIGASGANLVLPATVQIGNAVLTESGGSLAMPENMAATTMSASGNITGSYFLGNGSQLTGIDATSIQNGNSNVRVQANSSVTVGVTGTANVAVFSTTGVSVAGNITAGNVLSEGYYYPNGSPITGGAAVGGGTDQVFFENDQSVTANYAIPNARNAMTVGPLVIDDGVVITIPDGGRWIVL